MKVSGQLHDFGKRAPLGPTGWFPEPVRMH